MQGVGTTMDADKTVEKGSYENPTDLTPNLYNRIRFLESGGTTGEREVALHERAVRPLRRCGVHEGLPGAGGAPPDEGWDRRLRQGEVHFVQVLRLRLPVQHPPVRGGRQGDQVPPVLRPGRRGQAPGVRPGVPDPDAPVRGRTP